MSTIRIFEQTSERQRRSFVLPVCGWRPAGINPALGADTTAHPALPAGDAFLGKSYHPRGGSLT